MRVIAGEKRHLLLKTIDDFSIRPTTDKIKETLFNMIQFEVPGKNFLDLFAGSGAIGIEALSRGAKKATFVDNNDKAIKIIKDNLNHTGLIEKATVIKSDARLSIESLTKKNDKYEIVYMDPPYDKGLYLPVFECLSKSSIIDDKSIIVLELGLKDDAVGIEEYGFKIIRIKKYKSNKHLFIKRMFKENI